MTPEKLLAELRYETETEQAVLKKLNQSAFSVREIAGTAYSGENFDYFLCRRMPLTRLAVVTQLVVEKYHDYKKLGASDSVIFDTFRDVSLRAGLYRQRTGKPGLSKEDVIWFRHIMNGEIFKLGALQFQPFQMIYLDEETLGEPYMTFSREQKAALPPGAPVLNCHIQQGADLRDEAVEGSLRAAEAFFREHGSRVSYRAFLCYSWMLYPPMTARLSRDSNIRRFAERFRIIGACPDRDQAMETLFPGKNKSRRQTSLQRMAAEHPEYFGYACGVIPL